jgi:hypothetical protein
LGELEGEGAAGLELAEVTDSLAVVAFEPGGIAVIGEHSGGGVTDGEGVVVGEEKGFFESAEAAEIPGGVDEFGEDVVFERGGGGDLAMESGAEVFERFTFRVVDEGSSVASWTNLTTTP